MPKDENGDYIVRYEYKERPDNHYPYVKKHN